MRYAESQAFRLYRRNGKTHEVWARSDADAIAAGRTWARPSANLAKVARLEAVDNNKGCWTRAKEHVVFDVNEVMS